jgi:hypothetical protein
VNYKAPFEAYQKLSDLPMMESAALGTAGGLGARMGSDLLARAFLGLSLIGKDTKAKEEAFARMQAGKGYNTFKNLATVLGLGAGVAYPMLKNYNSRMGLKDNLMKYIDRKGFYDRNPDQLKADADFAKQNKPNATMPYVADPRQFRSGRSINRFKTASDNTVANWAKLFDMVNEKSGLNAVYRSLDKVASAGKDISPELRHRIELLVGYPMNEKEAFYQPDSAKEHNNARHDFTSPVVPVNQGIQLIQRDPFLSEQNKAQVNHIMANTHEGSSGSVSGFDLAGSAIKAGVGLVSGIAFGKTMGNLFSLGQAQTERLSQIGAVAGAIYNTGILSSE